MAQITQTPQRLGAYVRSIRWGLAVLVAMAAIVWYGAYGDPHPKASQEQAVPGLIALMAVITAVVFLAVVAPGLRSAAAHIGRWGGIGLALGILGLLAVPFAAWSGLPLTLGTAAALLGSTIRTAANASGRPTRLATSTLVVGVAAIVLSVVMVVVGNTVMSS